MVALADDLKLVEMAQEPAHELFPILRRSAAMTPLVLLLAVIPGLVALSMRRLDDASALWGLRALSVLTAGDLEGVLIPAADRLPRAVNWYAPLHTWLTAAAMALPGGEHSLRLVLTSYLASVGLVVTVFEFVRRIAGVRIGLLTTMLLAFNAEMLEQFHEGGPSSLGQLFAVATYWGYTAHLRQADHWISLSLLFAGVALGLCLLAAGPLALVVLLTLLLHALLVIRDTGLFTPPATRGRARRTVGRTALKSLAVLALTAFSVGGWWELMMGARFSRQFWWVWLTGSFGGVVELPEFAAPPDILVFIATAVDRLMGGLGLLIGPAVFGAWRARLELSETDDVWRRRWLQLVLVWAVGAGLVWLVALYREMAAEVVLGVWEGFLLLPGIILAAFAVDEIIRRQVPVAQAVGIILFSAAVVVFRSVTWWGGGTGTESVIWPVLSALPLLTLLTWLISNACRDSESRSRTVLQTFLVLLFVANVANETRNLWAARQHVPELEKLREELASATGVAQCTVVSEREPPPRLIFMIRSLWPTAEIEVVTDLETAPTVLSALREQWAEGRQIIVTWGRRAMPLTTARGRPLHVTPIADPQFFDGDLLNVYTINGAIDG